MSETLADVQQDGSRVIIRVHPKEVDTDALRELVMSLKLMLHEGEARTFVFCLDPVEFLPSACLALLLMLYQEVKQVPEGRVVLLNCQENVSFLMRLARLDALFELAEGDAKTV